MKSTGLAENLRLLCSAEPSISAVCRQIGINRQQFNKYLNGTSRPSATNLRRIAFHFGIRPAEFMLPPDEFEAHPSVAGRVLGAAQAHPAKLGFDSAFRGQTVPLRRYLGYYLSYFLTESWDNSVICAMVRLDERDGYVRCKSLERSVDPEDGSLYLSKYDGRVAMLGNRIFVLEFQSLARDALVETVLYPVGRGQLGYLRGTTFGITSRQRTPFTSPIVWHFLGVNVDLRKMMRKVGRYDVSSPLLDHRVSNILGGGQRSDSVTQRSRRD
ncbi:helix-turn-helix domain-containing protein [Hoeflea alexandrii]|uniref:helix-turn-helix domain-containing protein n=1 Tax=Hoeflea alexandrii TaxID=288436 RepID=UPI0022AE741A|nr:helix-turn-helix transcriptional regulator [Hoeflea alexandrii]MCZ4292320.1 helix-turn-helix transcriptional regulator [Hoeflea alexandrii]